MEDINKLIERFWKGTATTTENQKLEGWLVTDADEWKQYSEARYKEELNGGTNHLTEAESAEILQKLHAQMGVEMKPAGSPAEQIFVRPWWEQWKWMAAAAVLLTAGLWVFHSSNNHPPKVASYTPHKKVLRQMVNNGREILVFKLDDSSEVKLYPKSSASFYQPFDSLARSISLSGKGKFKVAKDAARPFRVYAGGLVTTALGTEFVITAPMAGNIVIKLLEGKVVVKAVPGGDFRMKDSYLLPGQELLVDKRLKQTTIKQFQKDAVETNIREQAVAGSSAPVTGLTFNRTPLEKVFNQLELYYKTQIVFEKKEVEGLSFTGALMPSDSLGIALSAVCSTNDLIFREEAGKMTVYKKK